jgi:hypothetical protein
MSSTPWLVAVSNRVYRMLLLGYPKPFRQRLGPEMAQTFRDCVRDAYNEGDLLGLWTRTLGDLIISVPAEHVSALRSTERSHIMPWNTGVKEHPFTERLAQVLDREPTYYQLLISTEPTRRMSDVIDCLALDGDWEHPELTLALFQELRQDVPEAEMDRWLGRLRDAARRIYTSESSGEPASLTDRILHLIYADPHLYELIAAVEPGYGLLEVIESLALEMNLEEVEPALALMRKLCKEPTAVPCA